jgi:hypothetical protein
MKKKTTNFASLKSTTDFSDFTDDQIKGFARQFKWDIEFEQAGYESIKSYDLSSFADIVEMVENFKITYEQCDFKDCSVEFDSGGSYEAPKLQINFRSRATREQLIEKIIEFLKSKEQAEQAAAALKSKEIEKERELYLKLKAKFEK